MTPEQLDEIEKLAEAATPGPWRAQLSDKGHALFGPLPNGECGSMRIALSSYAAFDRANMLFAEAMRDATLPLVKALREAWMERDEAFRERADWMCSLDRSKADIITLMRERDEARAEATRQTERLMQSEELTDQLHKERDEARAEVERLKAALEEMRKQLPPQG